MVPKESGTSYRVGKACERCGEKYEIVFVEEDVVNHWCYFCGKEKCDEGETEK